MLSVTVTLGAKAIGEAGAVKLIVWLATLVSLVRLKLAECDARPRPSRYNCRRPRWPRP